MARQWTWVKTDTPPKNRLSKIQKERILASVARFVESHYKARVPPPPIKPRGNYVIDYSVRWRGSYLHFIAKYACPGPNAFVPEFDHMFARLGCFGPDRFNLWARRYTGEWIVLDDGLTLGECLERMSEDRDSWFEQ